MPGYNCSGRWWRIKGDRDTGSRRKYPQINLADVLPLRPRTSNAIHCELPTQQQSQKVVVPALNFRKPKPNGGLSLPLTRRKDIFITSASPTNASAAPLAKGFTSYPLQVARSEAHVTLHDLRDEAQALASDSNQDIGAGVVVREAKPKSKAKDGPVLKYHVKLAHS